MSSREVPADWWELACQKIPHPLACVSVDGDFIWVNDAFCRLVGYSSFELTEKKWQDITKVSDIGSDELSVNKVVVGERDEYYLEKQYVRKNGDFINVGVFVHRFPNAGDLLCFIASVDDITKDRILIAMQDRVNHIESVINALNVEREFKHDVKELFIRYWPVIAGVVTLIGSFIAWLISVV